MFIDSVCGMEIKNKKFHSSHDKRNYYFCSTKCKLKFEKESVRSREKVVIEFYNVWKVYELGNARITAVKGANLEISKGEFLSIQGPSGSGKSTFLHLIGCLDLPTKGSIFLDRKDISMLSESELAQIRGRKIGFVFQQFNLINTLNALENVMLPMIFQGKVIEERRKRAVELLDVVGLKDRMYHKPKELSGGQMQRVAIARALANDPDVILADEPTGNLDSSTGHSVMNVLVNLNKKFGKTIIVVTHDPYIAKYAKRKVNILDGQIAHDHQFMKRFIW